MPGVITGSEKKQNNNLKGGEVPDTTRAGLNNNF